MIFMSSEWWRHLAEVNLKTLLSQQTITAKYNGTMKAMFSTYINGLCNIKPMYFPFEKYQCFLNLEFDDFRHEYYMNGIETSTFKKGDSDVGDFMMVAF